MLKKSYVLVNGNVVYYKGGYSAWVLNEEELANFVDDGYENKKSAQAALRRLKKDSGCGWYWGRLNPTNWKIKTVEVNVTKTVNIY